jgi:tRNA-splicing ligase RtcB
MEVAQNYAKLNRWVIAKEILEYFNIEPLEKIESVHNYIDFNDKIVRKGAIRAHKGEKVIIPLNMAKGIVIGEGKGLKEWNFSAHHGAGRKLSRRKAKELLNLEEFKKTMEEHGVWSTSVSKKTLDEAPFAYKEPEKIIPYLKEVIEIKEIAKSIYNFKA